MVYKIIFWANNLRHKDIICTIMSPCTIVTGSKIYHNKHLKLEFGAYVKSTNFYSPITYRHCKSLYYFLNLRKTCRQKQLDYIACSIQSNINSQSASFHMQETQRDCIHGQRWQYHWWQNGRTQFRITGVSNTGVGPTENKQEYMLQSNI